MLLNIDSLSKEINVSKSTLRRWEKEGKITSMRTTGKHRRYDLNEVMNSIKGMKPSNTKLTCCYARVSTYGQKTDLERQRQVLEMYCSAKGYQHVIIEDFGSGLNYNKKGLNKLLEKILNHELDRIVITHKDRLVRFGFEIISKLCSAYNVQLEIINQDENKIDDNKEFVNDVLEIITHFSSKLYGKKSNANKKIIEENKKMFKEN
jgi:excisionase family DNA binding protein